jgi:hypothetical protein
MTDQYPPLDPDHVRVIVYIDGGGGDLGADFPAAHLQGLLDTPMVKGTVAGAQVAREIFDTARQSGTGGWHHRLRRGLVDRSLWRRPSAGARVVPGRRAGDGRQGVRHDPGERGPLPLGIPDRESDRWWRLCQPAGGAGDAATWLCPSLR